MRQLFALAILLFSVASQAASPTIIFDTAKLTGVPVNRQITITLASQGAIAVGNNIVFNTPLKLQPVGGTVSAQLLPANYWVTIDQVPQRMFMPVPDSENTYNAIDLITDGLKHMVPPITNWFSVKGALLYDPINVNLSTNEATYLVPFWTNKTTVSNWKFYNADGFTPSTNCWTYPLDFSGLAAGAVNSALQPSGIDDISLITRQNGITAAHLWAGTVGLAVQFYGTNGQFYTNYVSGFTNIAGTDIELVTFSNAVPTNINPFAILPSNATNWLYAAQTEVVWLRNNPGTAGGPHMNLMATASPGGPFPLAGLQGDANCPFYDFPATAFDSGSPVFMVVGGRPIFLYSLQTSQVAGPQVGAPDYISIIASLIGTNKLTYADLSGFQSIQGNGPSAANSLVSGLTRADALGQNDYVLVERANPAATQLITFQNFLDALSVLPGWPTGSGSAGGSGTDILPLTNTWTGQNIHNNTETFNARVNTTSTNQFTGPTWALGYLYAQGLYAGLDPATTEDALWFADNPGAASPSQYGLIMVPRVAGQPMAIYAGTNIPAILAGGTQPANPVLIKDNNIFAGGGGLSNLSASAISTGTIPDARQSANVTLQGNSFNGANQLLRLDGSVRIPGLDGSQIFNLNASSLSSGTIPSARVPGYSGVINSSAGSTVTTFAPFLSSVLATAVSDETGFGPLVFGNSPTIDGPVISSVPPVAQFATFTSGRLLGVAPVSSSALRNQITDPNGTGAALFETGDGGQLVNLNASALSSGTLPIGRLPAFSGGDVTSSAGSGVLTLNNIGTAGTFTKTTYDAKGREVAGGTATLASSDFANQGTSSTLLHGNAAGNPSFGPVIESEQSLSDVTTQNASPSRHGYLPKLPNDPSEYLDATGGWTRPPGSSATTYYVATNGASSNPGSFAYPIDLATAMGKPQGSTLIFLPGTFTNILVASDNTTWRSLIKWAAKVRGAAGFHGISGNTGITNITVDGFEVDHSWIDGIKWNGDGWVVRNNWVHNSGQGDPSAVTNTTGLYTGQGISGHNYKNFIVEDNLIETNGMWLQHDHGIYIGGTNGIIRYNVLRLNLGYGIQNFAGGGNSSDRIYGYGNEVYLNDLGASSGSWPKPNGQRCVISTIDNGIGTNYWWNNTFISTNDLAFVAGGGTNYLTNNVIWGRFSGINVTAGSISSDYNAYKSSPINSESHALIFSEPGFVSTNNGNFYPTASSPLIGAAFSGIYLPQDYFGRTHYQASAIGAHPFNEVMACDAAAVRLPSPSYGADFWQEPSGYKSVVSTNFVGLLQSGSVTNAGGSRVAYVSDLTNPTNLTAFYSFAITNPIYGDFFFMDPTNHAWGFKQTNGNEFVYTNGVLYGVGTNTAWFSNVVATGWIVSSNGIVGAHFGDIGAATNGNYGALTGGVHTVTFDASSLWPGDTLAPTWTTNTPGAGSLAIQSAGPTIKAWSISQTASNRWLFQLAAPEDWDHQSMTLSIGVLSATNSVPANALTNVWAAGLAVAGTAIPTMTAVTNKLPAVTGGICQTNFDITGLTVAGTVTPGSYILGQIESRSGNTPWSTTNLELLVYATVRYTATNTANGSIIRP